MAFALGARMQQPDAIKPPAGGAAITREHSGRPVHLPAAGPDFRISAWCSGGLRHPCDPNSQSTCTPIDGLHDHAVAHPVLCGQLAVRYAASLVGQALFNVLVTPAPTTDRDARPRPAADGQGPFRAAGTGVGDGGCTGEAVVLWSMTMLMSRRLAARHRCPAAKAGQTA